MALRVPYLWTSAATTRKRRMDNSLGPVPAGTCRGRPAQPRAERRDYRPKSGLFDQRDRGTNSELLMDVRGVGPR